MFYQSESLYPSILTPPSSAPTTTSPRLDLKVKLCFLSATFFFFFFFLAAYGFKRKINLEEVSGGQRPGRAGPGQARAGAKWITDYHAGNTGASISGHSRPTYRLSESRSRGVSWKCGEVAAEKHIRSHDSDLISQPGEKKANDENKRLFSILPFIPLRCLTALVLSFPSPRRFFVPIYNDTRGVNLCIRHEQILSSVWFQERDFLAPR